MAGKVIRDYVPGQNDFLHFAEVMNKNAEMDMRKNTAQNNAFSGGVPLQNVSGGVMPAVQGTGEVLSGSAQYDKLRGDFKTTGGKI